MADFNEYRYVPMQFRAKENRRDGQPLGTITGTVITYGDRATLPWGTEEVEAGAFGNVAGSDIIANRMHERSQPLARGGEIRLVDDKTSMKVEFDLPDNMWGHLVSEEVGSHRLRGLSLEFRTQKDEIDSEKNHRVIREATMYGFGVVDRPAYPQSAVAKRWADYFRTDDCSGCLEIRGEALGRLIARLRDERELSNEQLGRAAGISASTVGQIIGGSIMCPPIGRLRAMARLLRVPLSRLTAAAEDDGCEYEMDEESSIPDWARFGHYDDLGRYIVDGIMPMEPEYDGLEDRQMPRLRGRLPYNVDGVTSMARNEHVRFLPGAFGDSLEGEILALVGNNYDDPLGGTAQRSLTFRDSDEALEFRTGRIPETSVNRDFVAKLRGGFVRGVTAGWALQGSQTRTEDIEGGGKRIVVEKAMLCELRFRTRSAFPGESIQASRRNAPLLLRAV